MSLTQLLQSPQGHQLLGQLTDQMGLSTDQVMNAAGKLLPLVQTGLKQKFQSDPQGLTEILQNEQASLVQSADANQANPSNIAQVGNTILGQIFGSKEVSRNVALKAAQETGLDVRTMKSMLPMLASIAGGAILKSQVQPNKSGLVSSLIGGFLGKKAQTSGLNLDSIASFLDQDGDGSVADDLLEMSSYFLKK